MVKQVINEFILSVGKKRKYLIKLCEYTDRKLDVIKINRFIRRKIPSIQKFCGEEEAIETGLRLGWGCFKTLTSGGIKPEGEEQLEGFYITQKESEKAYAKELIKYLETQALPNGKHKIEWRLTPVISHSERGFKVRSRLAVW